MDTDEFSKLEYVLPVVRIALAVQSTSWEGNNSNPRDWESWNCVIAECLCVFVVGEGRFEDESSQPRSHLFPHF